MVPKSQDRQTTPSRFIIKHLHLSHYKVLSVPKLKLAVRAISLHQPSGWLLLNAVHTAQNHSVLDIVTERTHLNIYSKQLNVYAAKLLGYSH